MITIRIKSDKQGEGKSTVAAVIKRVLALELLFKGKLCALWDQDTKLYAADEAVARQKGVALLIIVEPNR